MKPSSSHGVNSLICLRQAVRLALNLWSAWLASSVLAFQGVHRLLVVTLLSIVFRTF